MTRIALPIFPRRSTPRTTPGARRTRQRPARRPARPPSAPCCAAPTWPIACASWATTSASGNSAAAGAARIRHPADRALLDGAIRVVRAPQDCRRSRPEPGARGCHRGRQAPGQHSDDETVVYDFIHEVLYDKDVSDKTYAAAVSRFGEKTVLDMLCTSGYFGLSL